MLFVCKQFLPIAPNKVVLATLTQPIYINLFVVEGPVLHEQHCCVNAFLKWANQNIIPWQCITHQDNKSKGVPPQ